MWYGPDGLGNVPKLRVAPLAPENLGTFQTVGSMERLVDEASRTPAVRYAAEEIVRSSNVREGDERGEVGAVFDWVKRHYHYLADPYGFEQIKTPALMLAEIERNGEYFGDCDDATVLVLALLKSIGYPVAAVVMSSVGNLTGRFNHVLGRVYMPRAGRWLALDLTAKGKPLGWSPRSSRSVDWRMGA